MEKTPNFSKMKYTSRRNNTDNSERNYSENSKQDSSHLSVLSEDPEESPVHIACTQEGSDDLEVTWDWNSPQAKPRPKRNKKRLILSPKVPIKRYPSNNQIHNFEKLKEELQSLREDLAIPDNEDCLVLSPVEEATFKDESSIKPLVQENYLSQSEEIEDFFNDSIEQQMIAFSQQLESTSNTETEKVPTDNKHLTNNLASLGQNSSVQNSGEKFNSSDNHTKISKREFTFKRTSSEISRMADDSFDSLLKDFDLEQVSRVPELSGQTNIKHTSTQNCIISKFPNSLSESSIRINTGRVEFHRTQSFELCNQGIIPESKIDQIERRRQEAKAKLELKRKKEFTDSPIKCSPEEIEQKRLLAKAKLEAKRAQDIIERKRQEAIKRRELSRMKNATMVKSSLSKRM